MILLLLLERISLLLELNIYEEKIFTNVFVFLDFFRKKIFFFCLGKEQYFFRMYILDIVLFICSFMVGKKKSIIYLWIPIDSF